MNGNRISLSILFLLLLLLFTLLPSLSAQSPNTSDSTQDKADRSGLIRQLIQALDKDIEPRKKVDILKELCFEYRASNPAKALEYAKQGEQLSRMIEYPEGLADSLTLSAIIHYEGSRYDEALKFYLASLEVYRKHDLKKGIAKTLYNTAALYLDKGNYDKAMDALIRARDVYEQIDDKSGMININNILGIIYNSRGQFVKALEYYNRSLQISREINDRKTMAVCYNNIGTLYQEQGYFSKAMENFMKTLEIHEQMDFKNGMAAAYFNIASVYQATKEYEEALANYHKSLDIYRQSGDRRAIGNTLNNIGSIYYEKREFQRALETLEKALNIHREIGSRPAEAKVLYTLAGVYRHLENYSRALELFAKAKIIYSQLNNKMGLADVDTGIGSCYAFLGRNKKAVTVLARALNIAREIDYPPAIKKSSAYLHNVYAAMNRHRDAYRTHLLFKSVSDKLKNDREVKKLTKLELQYEFRTIQREMELEQKKEVMAKETEIKKQRFLRHAYFSGFLLMGLIAIAIYGGFHVKRKTNLMLAEHQQEILAQTVELELANTELKELNATKDKFFSIIAHDLKNPFSALIGSLKTLVTDFESFDKKEVKELLQITHESSEVTYSLLENLLLWSRNQTGKIQNNPEPVLINEAVETAISLVRNHAIEKSIEIENRIENGESVYTDKKMLQLILRNLISNAVKYTPNGGSVHVETRRLNGSLEIKVTDTGIGIAEEDIEKLFRMDTHFSRTGTADEQGTGLGLILCKEFIEMNKGTIDVESRVGEGSTFIISLPSSLS